MNEYAHIFIAIAHDRPIESKNRAFWVAHCPADFLEDYVFGINTNLMKPECYRERPADSKCPALTTKYPLKRA